MLQDSRIVPHLAWSYTLLRANVSITMGFVKRFPFTPVLGWSATRYDIFKTCKRQYFYHYYGKHDPDTPKSKIDALKSLRSIPMEIGTTVHDCLATLFKRLIQRPNEPVDTDKYLVYADKQADIHAKERRFAETHYRVTETVRRSDLESPVRNALENFLESERYRWITQRALRYRERWIIDPPGYGETRIRGAKAYSRVDFLIPEDVEITILEWKTGKEREEHHTVQLKGYAAWALYHTQVALSDIKPVIAYLLPDYREISISIDDPSMEEFYGAVESQTKEMYGMCRDVEQNLPYPRDSFVMTDSLQICRHCNFRELCQR